MKPFKVIVHDHIKSKLVDISEKRTFKEAKLFRKQYAKKHHVPLYDISIEYVTKKESFFGVERLKSVKNILKTYYN